MIKLWQKTCLFSGIAAACCVHTDQISSRICMKKNVPLELTTVFAAEKEDDDSGIEPHWEP